MAFVTVSPCDGSMYESLNTDRIQKFTKPDPDDMSVTRIHFTDGSTLDVTDSIITLELRINSANKGLLT